MIKNTRDLVTMAMFIVLHIVFTRFLSVTTDSVRVSFTFIPMAIGGLLLGSMKNGLTAALADGIGMILFPTGGAYFFGFTLSAFLSGWLYGRLQPRENIMKRLVVVSVADTVLVNMILNTLWLSIMLGYSFTILVWPRAIRSVVTLVIQLVILPQIMRYLINIKGVQR